MPFEALYRDKNYIVFPRRVNWATYRDFSGKLHAMTTREAYDNVTIDLSGVTKAYPNGIVPIIAEIAAQVKKGYTFNIIPPNDYGVASVFQNKGWLHHLDPSTWEAPKMLGFTSLPLQRFTTDIELNDIVNQAVEVCLQQLVFAEGVPQAFEWALNEIAGNVLVHSEADTGWIQVVTYKETHQLALIVCDSGIGIPQSMKAMYSFKNDQEAIEMAMRKGVTSKPKFGQGNGLAGAMAIAQHSQGMFALTSQAGRVRVLEGNVELRNHVPPYKGTCVDMQFSTDRQIDLPKALWGHEPIDYMETKFEDDKGNLVFRLREYASSFGNRITGERLRNLVTNLLKQNPGHAVEIIMDDVVVISSSFADELFGKLFIALGPIDFSRLIRFKGINATCKSIMDIAISQRIAQTMRNITPIE